MGSPASIGDTGQYMAVTDDGEVHAFGRTERIARRRLRRKVCRWRHVWKLVDWRGDFSPETLVVCERCGRRG